MRTSVKSAIGVALILAGGLTGSACSDQQPEMDLSEETDPDGVIEWHALVNRAAWDKIRAGEDVRVGRNWVSRELAATIFVYVREAMRKHKMSCPESWDLQQLTKLGDGSVYLSGPCIAPEVQRASNTT